jgi:uncharacterized membrane protein
MKGILRHVSRVMVAGIVALLPIGGIVLGVMYFESELAAAWLSIDPKELVYFPGLGLISVFVVIYVVGLLVSTFLGRMLWKLVDAVLTRLPLLGTLYNTLKQILGYGEGGDAVFQRVVFVKDPDMNAEELGLVTNKTGVENDLVVFIPGSPVPTAGRLIVIPEASTRPVDMSVKDALTALVSIGKSDMDIQTSS